MISTAATSLVWDLSQERATLGGALVLRMEGELFSQAEPECPIEVYVVGAAADDPQVTRLFTEVFASSSHRFELIPDAPPPPNSWPPEAYRSQKDFSNFSFRRLNSLHEITDCPLQLSWHARTLAAADSVRRQISGGLVCLHLRRVAPYSVEESNADPEVWARFLSDQLARLPITFLLVGDDPVADAIPRHNRILRARELGLPLAVQFAIVAQADGFLGMASGVCTAANLSATPHVIFKHPAHHAAAMEAELGGTDRFPFAGPRQRLWRRMVDATALGEALDLVLS